MTRLAPAETSHSLVEAGESIIVWDRDPHGGWQAEASTVPDHDPVRR
jgi:hypothetical protein